MRSVVFVVVVAVLAVGGPAAAQEPAPVDPAATRALCDRLGSQGFEYLPASAESRAGCARRAGAAIVVARVFLPEHELKFTIIGGEEEDRIRALNQLLATSELEHLGWFGSLDTTVFRNENGALITVTTVGGQVVVSYHDPDTSGYRMIRAWLVLEGMDSDDARRGRRTVPRPAPTPAPRRRATRMTPSI